MAENWLEMVEKRPFTFRELAKSEKIFAFCIITSEPIEVETHSASQNDCLNLSFVKYIKVVVKTMASNGQKTAIRKDGSGRLLHNGDRLISLL